MMPVAIPPRVVQLVRILLFACIAILIHRQHQRWVAAQRSADVTEELLSRLQPVFSTAVTVLPPEDDAQRWQVTDADGTVIGSFLKTLPAAEHILGFSGPTDVLLVVGDDQRVTTATILSSRDTREHVNQIRQDPRFLSALQGLHVQQPERLAGIDAVSGATLTSFAILESVRLVMSQATDSAVTPDASLRFPNPPRLSDVAKLFPEADEIARVTGSQHRWQATTADGRVLGQCMRFSPAADNIVGYQGPTDALIAVDDADHVIGIAVGVSYDNEPYVDYVRDDDNFLSLFNGRTLTQLAGMDPAQEGVEGVSGATMTSIAVAEGLVAAAAAAAKEPPPASLDESPPTGASSHQQFLTLRNASTVAIALLGVVIGLSHLRGRRWLRLLFQLLVIAWLGFVNGDMVSQALLLGWAQSGIAWQQALGLTLLTLAALIVPLATGHNVYCSHICPHGAVQQLVRNRLPFKLHTSDRVHRLLKLIPAALLIWVMLIGLLHLPFSAVDIEPFDAWLVTIAGSATVALAVIGLAASTVLPMAYCRYGCPTGALLNLIRFTRRDQFGRRDIVIVLLVVTAWILTQQP